MKPILTLVAALWSLSLCAQNWQSIHRESANFYEDSTGYFLISEIDSFQLQGADTLLYPFRTLRDTGSVYNDMCPYDPTAHSWMGGEILIRTQGDNRYQLNGTDTLLIKTQAGLGTSYVASANPDSNRVSSLTVIAVDTMTIFGVLDSVKTFQLSHVDTAGATIVFPSSGYELVLSKQNGWVQFYPFELLFWRHDLYPVTNYEFLKNYHSDLPHAYQLAGNGDPQYGPYVTTEREAFVYQVGDIMHTTEPGPSQTTVLAEVLTVDDAIDSVRYEWKKKYIVPAPDPNGPGTIYYVSFDTAWSPWYRDDVLVMREVPERTYLRTDNFIEHTQMKRSTFCGATFEYRTESGPPFADGDTCYGQPIEYPYAFTVVYPGVGFEHFYEQIADGVEFFSFIDYVELSGVPCGTEYNGPFSITEPEAVIVELDVFPNPAREQFRVDLPSFETGTLELLDMNGRVVWKSENVVRTITVATNAIDAGVYVLRFQSETKTGQARLVVQ